MLFLTVSLKSLTADRFWSITIEMNTVQLTAIMDKISCNVHFLGVLPSDQLPERPLRNLPSMLMMNIHPAELSGEHWLAVYLQSDGTGYFFDSFGNAPNSDRFPATIKNFLLTNAVDTIYSDRRVQDFESDTCGQHCVFFLYHLTRGHDYNNVMKLYSDDYIKNDKMASCFVKRLKPNVCIEKCSCIQCVQMCNTYMNHN